MITQIEVSGPEGTFVTDLAGLNDLMDEASVDYVWESLAERDIVYLGERSYRVVGEQS